MVKLGLKLGILYCSLEIIIFFLMEVEWSYTLPLSTKVPEQPGKDNLASFTNITAFERKGIN